MPFIVLFGLVIYLIYDSISRQIKANRCSNALIKDGFDRRPNAVLEDLRLQELNDNWEYGDKSMYPERLVEFFKQDSNARACYAICRAAMYVVDKGYAPKMEPIFRESRWNPWLLYQTSGAEQREKEFMHRKEMLERISRGETI